MVAGVIKTLAEMNPLTSMNVKAFLCKILTASVFVQTRCVPPSFQTRDVP
jgi:hypothetical protein